MYVVKATEELLIAFLTKGNKIWEGKCFQGLPQGCTLEKVITEPREHGGHYVIGYFSHPDDTEPEEEKSIQVNYETKHTRKLFNSMRKRRH